MGRCRYQSAQISPAENLNRWESLNYAFIRLKGQKAEELSQQTIHPRYFAVSQSTRPFSCQKGLVGQNLRRGRKETDGNTF
jgi:hypothetical protein